MVYEIATSVIEEKHDGYFFSEGAMRFLKSRISAIAYKTQDGTKAFFVTSEKCCTEPRLYSVRVFDFATLGVNTVGEFQEYKSRSAAVARAKKEAGVPW